MLRHIPINHEREINVEAQMRYAMVQMGRISKSTNVEKGYTAIHYPDKPKYTHCDLYSRRK